MASNSFSVPDPPSVTGSNLSTTPLPNGTTLSEDDIFAILFRSNEEKATLYIPVIVYMAILTIIGTFGNILVVCVYGCKPTKASSTFFILALAVLDLLTCLIGMPTEITDLRYPYMFYAPAACKLLRFIESVTTIGSSMILISVAVDRYLRICKLGKQISVKAAKRICVASMFVGVGLSWPASLIFGKSTTEVHPGIWGEGCSTDDSMRKTHYPSMYYGFLGLLFICCITFFTIIYCHIGLQIWRQKKAKIGERSSRDSGTLKSRTFSNSSTKDSQVTEIAAEDTADSPNGSDPVSTDISSEQMNEACAKKKLSKDRKVSTLSTASTKSKTPQKRKIKVTRTTIVLFAVTVAYIVSYLPFLILMVVRSVKKDFEENLKSGEEVAYKLGVKSYFINNSINPLIYSFLNINFRKDAKKFLVRVVNACCGCCRRRSADT